MSVELHTRLTAALAAGLIPPTRREFAQSLAEFWTANQRWTERQLFWVNKLLELAAEARPAPDAPGADAPDMPAVGVSAVLGWFRSANRPQAAASGRRQRIGVTYPRPPGGGASVRLSSPSATSRHSADDTIFVQADRQYAGRITAGRWIPAAGAPAGFADRLRALLADPLNAAISDGRRTGSCCFCSRLLTDQRSVSVGYGPICADRYGLPWGTHAGADGSHTPPVSVTYSTRPQPIGRSPRVVASVAERIRAAHAAAVQPPPAPALPNVPTFSEGGPDDEDRQFC